jgi:hypothetical protein
MGFYSNLHGVILSWPNEAINVAAKTAFGMIYLVPLAIERKNTLAEPPPA